MKRCRPQRDHVCRAVLTWLNFRKLKPTSTISIPTITAGVTNAAAEAGSCAASTTFATARTNVFTAIPLGLDGYKIVRLAGNTTYTLGDETMDVVVVSMLEEQTPEWESRRDELICLYCGTTVSDGDAAARHRCRGIPAIS